MISKILVMAGVLFASAAVQASDVAYLVQPWYSMTAVCLDGTIVKYDYPNSNGESACRGRNDGKHAVMVCKAYFPPTNSRPASALTWSAEILVDQETGNLSEIGNLTHYQNQWNASKSRWRIIGGDVEAMKADRPRYFKASDFAEVRFTAPSANSFTVKWRGQTQWHQLSGSCK